MGLKNELHAQKLQDPQQVWCIRPGCLVFCRMYASASLSWNEIIEELDCCPTQVDAFASEAFKGNPAAVVFVHGRQLTSLQMQAIAAENNLSETAFLEHSSPGELAEAAYFATSSEFNLRCAAVWLQQGDILASLGPIKRRPDQ